MQPRLFDPLFNGLWQGLRSNVSFQRKVNVGLLLAVLLLGMASTAASAADSLPHVQKVHTT